MHDACAVVSRDKVLREDTPCGFADGRTDQVEWPHVPAAYQLTRAVSLYDSRVLTEYGRNACFGQDQFPAVVLDLGVSQIRMDCERDVRWQRPRCSGPHQKRAAFIVQPGRQEIDRRIAYVFVTLRYFMRAERGTAARAIRHALV